MRDEHGYHVGNGEAWVQGEKEIYVCVAGWLAVCPTSSVLYIHTYSSHLILY